MNTLDLLARLRALDVHLWVDDGRLRCSAPKDVLTAELKAQLAASKADIIGILSAAESSTNGHASGETPESEITAAQSRLWLLDQFLPGNPGYNVPAAFRLEGPVDVERLREALARVVARHESLRCIFKTTDGKPQRVVVSPVSVELPVVDLEGQEATLPERLRVESRRTFDIARDLLFRSTLFRLSDAKHVLLLVTHHLSADAASVNVIVQELVGLYEGRSLPAPPRHLDYVRSEAEWLRSPAAAESIDYWRKQLDGDLPVISLPADRPRPARPTPSGAAEFLAVPEALSAQIAGLAERFGTTRFVLWLSVFQLLLHRYTSLTDIVVGCEVSNRTPEMEDAVGLFLNTPVFRTDFSGSPTFAELVERVRRVNDEARQHARLPFAKLLEALPQAHGTQQSPLFQVAFSVQRWPVVTSTAADLTIRQISYDPGIAKFDLSLNVVETEGSVLLGCEYNTDVFDRETIVRLLGHYLTLLKGAVGNPDRAIGDLPILSAQERSRILVEWNATASDYPRDTCLHRLIEQQAQKTPDAPAILFKDQVLTYRELNKRANRVAHALKAKGFQPGALAAICMERSADLIVAAIAVHKAGGAYLPLDPAYPADRIAFMLEDSAAPVLLTQKALADAFAGQRIQIVAADSASMSVEYSDENPDLPVDSERIAYVIYTSGSTGKPKGVQISQRALINFLISMQRVPGITAADTLLAVTTFSFDIAALELFLPLISGAAVAIVPREVALSGSALQAALEQFNATIMQATPTTWRMLLDSGWKGNYKLKALCGGEAITSELAQKLAARCGSLWNMYGPTETTIWSTVQRLGCDDAPITIGRPIANTTTYIVDFYGQPVPQGVTGELYIGGDSVAAGYLNRPELTAERFVDDPFTAVASGRIYRTGDLARYRADGVIELLGRVDHQVKIRGFRIELGEVEAALERNENVRRAAVVPVDAPGYGNVLVAYVLPRDGADCSVSTLRLSLKQTLPDYMVPSFFVTIDNIPLTPNGKVDRRALPDFRREQPEPRTVLHPETDLEATIAAVWKEALQLEHVGKKDNFFDLGGHSLLLVKVHDSLKEKLSDEIVLMDLFQYPTVESLAAMIQSKRYSLAAALA